MSAPTEKHVNVPIGKGIAYDHTRIEDKHYFAGFLNLAENNIKAVIRSYNKRYRTNISNVKNLLEKEFSDDLAHSEYENKLNFLIRHLPVVRYLRYDLKNGKEKQKKDKNHELSIFREQFKIIVDKINELRNFYTHFYHDPVSFDRSFFKILDNLFLLVIKDVKANRMKTGPAREILKESLRDEMKVLIKKRNEWIIKNKKRNKDNLTTTENLENGVLNDAFSHLMFKNKVHFDYQFKLQSKEPAENNITISKSGLLFLTGLFLTRKESESLRSRVKGFKGKVVFKEEEEISRSNNSLRYMATHWVFNYCAYRPVRRNLDTQYTKERLLIQIADELSKVPGELYDVLSEENQKKFIEDVNEYLRYPEPGAQNEEWVIHPVIRKRYENKFNYFVIRYLDEFIDFKSLKFQVHLGNYTHDQRKKNIPGTSLETNRVIKERIKVFENLSKLKEMKFDYFHSHDENTKTGWDIFPNPSYCFFGNNIPIYIDLNRDDNKMNPIIEYRRGIEHSQQKKKRKEGKPDKATLVKKINCKLNIKKPVAFLSMNEAMPLLYELLENKKSGEDIEKILVDKLNSRFNTIKNFEPEDKSKRHHSVPKNLRRSSSKQEINFAKFTSDIEKQITICKEKLADDRKQTKKHGRFSRTEPRFTSKELGQEATWLADDIKRFMPVDIRKNWKGFQHSHLQRQLALYDSYRKDLIDFLLEVWNFKTRTDLFSGNLKECLKEKTFESFYDQYFYRREKYFQMLLKTAIEYENDHTALFDLNGKFQPWNFFKKRLYLINNTEEQKRRLLEKPLVFDRGIFDDKPTFIKGKNPDKNPELFADWFQFIKQNQQPRQKFYSYDRDYNTLFQATQMSKASKEKKHKLINEQKLKQFKYKQDKKIEVISNQDLFLNMIVKDLLQRVFNISLNVSLADYYIPREERIQKERAVRLQSARKEGDASENMVKDTFIWSRTFDYCKGQIYEPGVKLKDFGKFHKLLNDKKVKNIFCYDASRKWSSTELYRELDSYEEIRREQIFKLIHDLEKEILNSKDFDGKNHPESLKNRGNPNFRKYIFEGVLKKCPVSNDDVLWLKKVKFNKKSDMQENVESLKTKPNTIRYAAMLIYLRNKFSHNQLPDVEYFELIKEEVTCPESETYAGILLQYMKNAAKHLLDQIQRYDPKKAL